MACFHHPGMTLNLLERGKIKIIIWKPTNNNPQRVISNTTILCIDQLYFHIGCFSKAMPTWPSFISQIKNRVFWKTTESNPSRVPESQGLMVSCSLNKLYLLLIPSAPTNYKTKHETRWNQFNASATPIPYNCARSKSYYTHKQQRNDLEINIR